MAKKNDIFDDFLNKNFGEEPVKIEKPVGGERTTTSEDREAIAKAAEEERKSVQEETTVGDGAAVSRGPGRPKNEGRGPVRNMNFLLEDNIRYDLEMLKVRQHRSSLTELLNEAIVDLFRKYKVEGY